MLADQLADLYEVTIIELADKPNSLGSQIEDIGNPAVTVPIASNGLGGTTAFWHNGLIEIDNSIFIKKWPYLKAELSSAYERAYFKLSGIAQDEINQAVKVLRKNLIDCGIPSHLMREALYYPNKRINLWKKFNLSRRVNLIYGSITNIKYENGVVNQLFFDDENGANEISADLFIFSAGGLGTPIIFQKLSDSLPKGVASKAGFYYEDHPTAFVGKIYLKNKIYKFMNFSTKSIKGFLRMPLVVEHSGCCFSFQLRSSSQLGSKVNLISLLNSIRNQPFNLFNYLKLINHTDDILDIISLKLGINLPTNIYSVLMVAEQHESEVMSIYWDDEHKKIVRNWQLSNEYIEAVNYAFAKFVIELGPNVVESQLLENWSKYVASSSHHSGTARMNSLPEAGVCNENGLVNEFQNLYICDGSVIPASGFSNTGLTIGALAIKLADYIKLIYK